MDVLGKRKIFHDFGSCDSNNVMPLFKWKNRRLDIGYGKGWIFMDGLCINKCE